MNEALSLSLLEVGWARFQPLVGRLPDGPKHRSGLHGAAGLCINKLRKSALRDHAVG